MEDNRDQSALVKLREVEQSAKKRFEAEVKSKTFDIDKVMEARTAYDAAQKVVSDWLDANKSPEERIAEREYEESKAEYEKAMARYEESKFALRAILEANGKKLTSERAVGDHTRKLEYADAQAIRQMIANGATNKEIKEKYGNSDSSIMYIKNYLQHKLRKGDEAFTPLVNPFYPYGAPMYGESYTEHEDKYKVKNWKLEDLLNTELDQKALAENYGTSEESIKDAIARAKAEATKKVADEKASKKKQTA